MVNRYHVIGIILSFLLVCGCTSNGTDTAPPSDRLESIPSAAMKVQPSNDTYPPLLHVTEFESPTPLPFPITTAGAEDSPFITPDGNTLYFFFTPDASIPPERQLLDKVTGVYVTSLRDSTWTTPQRIILQDPGKLALDGCVFVQGTIMWFCSAREGYTGVNLFTADYTRGTWASWQYAGEILNRQYRVGEMHITADGREMYFHSAREGGNGGLDLWVTRNESGVWQEPENVAAVNTLSNEGWPFLTQAGDELWFTRTYQGSPAIFRSKKIQASWQEPELVISSFAAEPSLDEKGNLYFAHHYIHDGALIEADIYVARKK